MFGWMRIVEEEELVSSLGRFEKRQKNLGIFSDGEIKVGEVLKEEEVAVYGVKRFKRRVSCGLRKWFFVLLL